MGSPGLPESCCPPRLWLWPGHAVFVGPSLPLDPHSGSVSCLVIAVDGTFTVRTDGSSGPAVRSALIPPRLTHQIVATANTMAFCYVEPGSFRHRACQGAMTAEDGPLAYHHRHENALATAAGHLADAGLAESWLDAATGPGAAHCDLPGSGTPAETGDRGAVRLDPRIGDALGAMRQLDPWTDSSAAHLAALVGLSQSRFLHLFRDHTGTSFRRYRLWLRMLRVAERVHDRADLTTAAVDAGFASPSHFSDSFHAMFGLRPSHLLDSDIRFA